ncbi:MAG: SPFH domain-containing protein [Deinococcota bacterium]
MGIITIIAVVFAFIVISYWISRYRRCPSNQILVVYGQVGGGKSAKVVHGGGAFVWPIIQSYAYLDLIPLTIDINLKNALSKQNIRVDVPSRFTVAISTDEQSMLNAAERLLGQQRQEIEDLAKDIIFGQLRATIATMDIEEINADRERFEKSVMDNIETELRKVGLGVINVNISDISDDGGYIEALGQKASAQAVNQAKVDAAEAMKQGESGSALAMQDQRIAVADAEAQAQLGENMARARIAESEAQLKVAEADARKIATVAERSRAAEARTEAFRAEQAAEIERAKTEEAKLRAEEIVPSAIAKQRAILEADAQAETEKRSGQGEAERLQAILEGQAKGLAEVVAAAGGDASAAVQLLYVQQLADLMKIQTEALKQVHFGDITLIGGGQDSNGQSNTGIANVLKELSVGMAGASAIGQQLGVPFLQPRATPSEPQQHTTTSAPPLVNLD